MKNLIFKSSFHEKLKFLIIPMMLLTLCVGQMWAAKGFFTDGQWNVQYWDGSSDKWIGEGGSGATKNLGIMTTLYLKKSWVKTWSNGGWSQSEVVWNYGLTDSYGNTKTATKSSVQGNQTWDFSVDYDLISHAPNNPGQNTLYMYWRLDNYVSTSASYINFTIPGFTTTSTSQTFDNTTVSSNSSKTISFGQHYGTALTTSNCALSGTNSTEFEVTSISETGVTVKFKPSSDGSKSATLTITDAHSKTCTITLSGKTRRAVTYKHGDYTTGSDITDYKVYGTNLTLRSSGFTRTGYNLTAWNTGSNGTSGTSYDLGATYSTNSTLTLYPTWTAKTTTITLNLHGGTSGDESVTATYDASLPSFVLAQKSGGYNLTGYWTAESSGNKIINADGTLVRNTAYTSDEDTPKWKSASASLTLHAQWNNFLSVTYEGNGNTGGSVPTDANEYSSGATVTVLAKPNAMVKTGYTFTGWKTGGVTYTAGQTFTITANTTLVAQWSENITTVTISVSPSGAGTLNKTSASVGVATTTTVTATAQPGYRFTGWTATNCSVASSSASTTLSGDGTTGAATLVANFARTYAYLEGRMTVYDAARTSETHTASSKGGWDESSTRIEMEYDETNHRFYRHTYKTPAELKAQISSQDQWFSVKTGTVHNSFASGTVKAYHPSNNTNIATAGTKYSAPTTATTYNFKFTNTATDGYAIIYFDEAGVWYELEQSLKYDANGGSGDAPTPTYYLRGTNATAASNPFTARKNYTFAGWNTAADITGTSYAAGASVPMSADRILYAKWNRSVTLDQQDATTPGSTSVTATWNCSTLPSITNPQKLGYEFGGWYTETAGNGNIIINTSGQLQANKTNWTVSGGKFQRTPSSDASESKPLYAKWTQTVTLDANTANHGSGSNKTATIVYKATDKSSITHTSAATGYHRVGYYTNATGGTKVLNADGSFASSAVTDYITSGKWTKAGATTLYAQYEVNTYTIHYDPNDAKYVGEATGSMDDQAVTWGNYPTLTSNGFTREGYTFAGWATSPTGAVVYSNGQTLSTNLTNDNNATVTLYAKWTGRTYTVTFNARGGSSLSPASKTVTMGATYGTLATVTPPAGYVFDGWYTSAGGGTKVTSATQVTTAVDHTLYAHYIQKAQVYFKNTLGWSKVYVTYGSEWHGNQGAGNQGKTYHKMQLVPGTTDVYYDDIPDGILKSWQWNVAFDNTGFCADEYKDNPTTGTYYSFNSGEAVFRYDFDKKATMFVPTSNKGANVDGNFDDVNGVQYRSTGYPGESSGPKYTSGYWRTYNNTYSGYTMTYQKNGDGDSWSGGHKMESAKVGDNVFCFTVNMEANSQYNFSFYKNYNVNWKSIQFCYNPSTQINSSNCTNLQLDCNPNNSYMQTTVAGEYTFQLEMKADGHMYLSVIYPLAVGDFRVRYNYTKGSAKTYYSEIIKGRANGKDTISIFIHSKDSASSRSLTVEQCTAISSGTPTWNTSYRTVTSKLPAATTAGGKTSGVYNFIITQNSSKEIILDNFAYWNKYTGNYYIRTASADGGWDFYKERSDNQMTLSEYSLTQTLSAPFSHYYCRFISEAERSTTDISYAIATDYSPNISGTMVGDATIGGDAVKVLPASANVRFSWNEETNAMRRAYLKNAQTENARFLVLHGSDNKVLSATGSTISAKDDLQDNELKFTDMGNWIYQVNLQAQPGAEVSLIANYNSADRYLIGGASSFLTIIDGTGSAKYEMIAVYDFKTNRLMIAWTPSGEVGQNLTDVDVLLVRYKQNAGTLITLGTGKSVTSKTVIGAIRFDYNDLVGHVADWNNNSRPLLKYFISFPFDVNVSDIFGLNSAYGDAYEIQTYDGAERARKGFFRGDGTTTFWRTLQPGEVMKANEGYCVIMDNDYLNNDIGHVWDNKVAGSSVYLYFPSAGSVGSIASSSKTIAIPSRPCTINRTFTTHQGTTREVNHMNTDSHWNMMGVPIFANTTGDATAGTPGAVFATSGTDGDGNFNYYYQWNSSNNQFSIHTARGETFKSMHSYMVQYYGNVTFTGAHPAASVARRAPAESHQIELQVLNSEEDVINRAYVELRENACDTFMLNEDVYMWTTNQAVDIYTFAGNYDVSANVLSLNDQMIPVGVEVRKAGTYIFSMPSNFSGTATLVDTFTGARTNLALSDYEVELEKGIITDRFLLELSIEKVTTVMETVNGGGVVDTDVRKVLIDGVLYIVKDGKVFDARGARVQ